MGKGDVRVWLLHVACVEDWCDGDGGDGGGIRSQRSEHRKWKRGSETHTDARVDDERVYVAIGGREGVHRHGLGGVLGNPVDLEVVLQLEVGLEMKQLIGLKE